MVGMHIRERNAAFFDRRLQLSNAQRRETLAWITNVCGPNGSAHYPFTLEVPDSTVGIERIGRMPPTETGSGQIDDASVLVGEDGHDDGQRYATHCGGGDEVEEHCWYQRSQCTPEPNYAARARAATPGCSSSCVVSSDGRGRWRSPSAASGRPLLIRLQRGSGGLAEQCLEVETNFGTGSAGLGTERLEQIKRQVEKARVASWLDKKDRWLMDDRQRDQVRAKEWARAAKTKSVAEHVQLRMLQEERKATEFREWKASEGALAREAAAERDALTTVERNDVAVARRLASQEATRRHEEMEAHRVALQHLGRFEQAARRIEACHRDDERRAAVERLQHTKRSFHATADAQRTAAMQSIVVQKKAAADALRASEAKWDARVRKDKKEDASQAHDFVKKLHASLRQGTVNARELLEMHNAARHNAVKKESTRMLAKLHDRQEATRESARRLAEEVRLSSPPREGRASPVA